MQGSWTCKIVTNIKGESAIESDFWSSSYANSPSDCILSKCFLTKFLMNEQQYIQEISSIQCGRAISFDHTFRIAANIGYLMDITV